MGTEEGLRECGIVLIVCEKGCKSRPPTVSPKASLQVKSSTKSRVEHVFGFMEQSMMGLAFRGMGMVRAKAHIALTNLVYNLCESARR